ncbi:YkgJ family cysteine cluster protein [Thermodesulfobacteriota bacterium]
MEIDFTPFFRKYEQLVVMADEAFERVKKEYPLCVKCKIACDDCCYALFDLSLIEAMYINYHFNRKFDGTIKENLLGNANTADRKTYNIKRNAYRKWKDGKGEDEIFKEIAEEHIRCPLLNKQQRCDLYEYRPITCRLYGIPTAIGGKGHTCGISGFRKGEAYPTVNLDIIHKKLYEISLEFVQAIESKHFKMADILVPLSMALLTVYDEEYLGLLPEKEEKEEE